MVRSSPVTLLSPGILLIISLPFNNNNDDGDITDNGFQVHVMNPH